MVFGAFFFINIFRYCHKEWIINIRRKISEVINSTYVEAAVGLCSSCSFFLSDIERYVADQYCSSCEDSKQKLCSQCYNFISAPPRNGKKVCTIQTKCCMSRLYAEEIYLDNGVEETGVIVIRR